MIISSILLYFPLFFAIVTTFLLNFSLFFYKIDVTIIVAYSSEKLYYITTRLKNTLDPPKWCTKMYQ